MRTKDALLSWLVSLAMVFSCLPTAFADDSTTTLHTAYQDISDNTEIYAVTQTAGSDYVYYGAKWEPKGGALYGRTGLGGTRSDGSYGLVNADAFEGESVISFYYGLSEEHSLEYWSYLFGSVLEDGNHAFLVYLNFDQEGADCPKITAGQYDSKLNQTFSYLSTLECPVFLRIGGEMNVWTTATTPEQFIAAYRHIAQLARAKAPNVALVFSPNYSSAYQVDMDSFYPGDSYVDWVGTSLYYNRYANNGDTARDEFYGVGIYGDALLNVQQTVNLSKLHRKPVIITEGGSSNQFGSQDNSAWAAQRMQKAFSFLTMVYPQIKCIVSSDYGNAWENTNYTFYNNAVVTAAYEKAVSSNPTLLHSVGDTGAYYTRLSAYSQTWSGSIPLAAYTYSPDKLTATWYVDGSAVGTADDYPYQYTLNADALSPGSHTLAVKFSNGASKTYTFRTAVYTAMPSNDKLYVDGQAQTPSIYKIDGYNYFKLGDMAALLNGTKAQFKVAYDPQTAQVNITTGQRHPTSGGELAGQTDSGNRDAIPTNNDIYVDGQKVELTVYKIDGSNYFRLMDLGRTFNFYVGYDPNVGVSISGNRSYNN